MTDGRLARVRVLLERAGLDAAVSTAGASAEIVAVRARPAQRARLALLAPEIREAGFRYVTIELDLECP
jgi:hypothetical protein